MDSATANPKVSTLFLNAVLGQIKQKTEMVVMRAFSSPIVTAIDMRFYD